MPVGEGTIPRTTPLTYGTPGFAVGYQPGGPISAALPGRQALPDGVLRRVVIEALGKDRLREAVDQPPADLATQ